MKVWVRDVEKSGGCWVVYYTFTPHALRADGKVRTFNEWEASLCKEHKLRAPLELEINHSQFGSRIKSVSLTEAKSA